MSRKPTFFQRIVLPGLAFKAVVIGGGYATGRELVEFFLPSGPSGGVLGMLVAMLIWSIVCMLTFACALQWRSFDYRSFFRELLGPAWIAFEIIYLLVLMLILSVFGAAAGAISSTLLQIPAIVGTLALVAAIGLTTAFGNRAVERLFKYVSFFLYAIYAVFVILSLVKFGDRIRTNYVGVPVGAGWAVAGLSYAGYNILGAVLILPVLRHMQRRRDAIIAGVLCGPLAMLPALLFYVSMCAFYPQISMAALPSDYVLEQLGWPAFRILFQLMVFSALLESGVGCVNAVNERVASWYAGKNLTMSGTIRLTIALVLMVVSMFVATQVGLIELIGVGYRLASGAILLIFVLPLVLRVLRQMFAGAWHGLFAQTTKEPQ